MKKIKKYLQENNVSCDYLKYYTARHYNGRSFYNDGTYGVDVYLLGDYEIHHKCTGRPTYWLYKNHQPITMRFSQRDFITVLEKIIVKEHEA